MPVAGHLARHALADLFLDTLPYNAHTTASDALWMGLPLLTCVGNTFPGRVAGSLLHALDMDELIADSLESYEAKALELSGNAALLSGIRKKLALRKQDATLFDTQKFTRDLEEKYIEVLLKHEANAGT